MCFIGCVRRYKAGYKSGILTYFQRNISLIEINLQLFGLFYNTFFTA